MFHVLIFVHVFSAVLLGSFVLLPVLVRRLETESSVVRQAYVKGLISFTRVGHYALILLLITGGGLIFSSTNKPPVAWVVTAVILLLMLSAFIGMISGNLKKLAGAELDNDFVLQRIRRIRNYSWLTTLTIIIAILAMTGM